MTVYIYNFDIVVVLDFNIKIDFYQKKHMGKLGSTKIYPSHTSFVHLIHNLI